MPKTAPVNLEIANDAPLRDEAIDAIAGLLVEAARRRRRERAALAAADADQAVPSPREGDGSAAR